MSQTDNPEIVTHIKRFLATNTVWSVVRRVEAGYDETMEFAEKNDAKVPMTI